MGIFYRDDCWSNSIWIIDEMKIENVKMDWQDLILKYLLRHKDEVYTFKEIADLLDILYYNIYDIHRRKLLKNEVATLILNKTGYIGHIEAIKKLKEYHKKEVEKICT